MTKSNTAITLSKKKLKSNLGQSILSLSFNTLGLLTGTIILVYLGILSLEKAPWAIFLYPGILSVRGAIGGLFSGHLGTGLHLGTIKPVLRQNTTDFYNILSVILILTLLSGISVGIGTWVFGTFLWNATLIDFIPLFTVIIATMALSVILVTPLTIIFSFLSFRRGLDPDVVVYPIASPVSDIIITSCYFISLSLFFMFGEIGTFSIIFLDILFIGFVLFILSKNIENKNFTKIIKEFLLTLFFVTVIVNITGFLLNKISNSLILSVYPSILATIGGVGSIIGSTATTKLALGLITPSFSSTKEHINEITGAWIASISMFIFYAVSSLFIVGETKIQNFLILTGQLVITNILAVFFMTIISFAIAIFTFRRGWNPDNFVIPIESSMADVITTGALIVALLIII